MNLVELVSWMNNDNLRESVRRFRQITSPRSGWAQSTNLATANSTKSGSMQATFGKSGIYTIQFNRIPRIPSDDPIFTEADIFWSQSGNYVSRTVSIVNGMSISGCGEAAKVVVRDTTTVGSAGREYDVTMQVTEGVRPSTAQPPLYIPRYIGSSVPLAGGPSTPIDTTILIVPAVSFVGINVSLKAGIIAANMAFTNQLIALPAKPVIASNDLLVTMVDNSGSGRWFAPTNNQWVPAVPGLAQVGITNYSATDIRFSIAYGIDG